MEITSFIGNTFAVSLTLYVQHLFQNHFDAYFFFLIKTIANPINMLILILGFFEIEQPEVHV